MNLATTPNPIPQILVVDDDQDLRERVADYLTQHGYGVHLASDGITMEQALAAAPIDLIVLDVMMPGEDGLSICRRVADAGGPAIIMVSAMGEEIDRILGLELGADDYLAKPCSPRELLARVRAVLRRREDSRAGAPPSRSASFSPAMVITTNVPPTQIADSSSVARLTHSAGASTPAASIHFDRIHSCRGANPRPSQAPTKVEIAAAAPNTGQTRPNNAGSLM